MTNQTVKESKKRSHWDPETLEKNLNITKQVRKITAERLNQKDSPFLSVIIRTQGKRFEALKEALLCLEVQTNDQFEVQLILHKATEEGKDLIRRLLAEQSPALREKIHVTELDTGTRTTPLNLGASLAKGTYFAMLDDDDLLFDNWVEDFFKGATEHPGKVIRCYGVTQAWRMEKNKGGEEYPSACGTIINAYCRPYDLVDHLDENYTPISCVAIPTACHQVCGVQFDESLTTAEDWDFITRCVMTLGIHDTEHIAFLYRLWSNAESSRTLHAEEEWDNNRKKIYEKLDRIPVVMDRRSLLRMKSKHSLMASTSMGVPGSDTQSIMRQPNGMLAPCTLGFTCRQIVKLLKNWARNRFRMRSYVKLLKSSALFDPQWYLETYADVRQAQLDPYRHYVMYGWRELRDPSEEFSTLRYLEQNPDVLWEGVCPLIHYEQVGRAEGREY
jgi:hypothetical protein